MLRQFSKARYSKQVFFFAQTEGIVPAPESAHAIAAAIKEAERCRKNKEKKTILICLSGHGFFDMTSYDKFLDGELTDYDYPMDAISKSIKNLPNV